MNRFSIYFLVTVSFVGLFISFDTYFNRDQWLTYYRKSFSERASRLPEEAQFAHSLVEVRENMQELENLLILREKAHAIDFWALLQDGKLYKTNIDEDELVNFHIRTDEPGSLIVEKDHSYILQPLSHGFILVMGLRYLEGHYLDTVLNDRKDALVKYALGVIFIAVSIFVFFFRDIAQSIRSLREHGRRRTSRLLFGFRSKEGDVLARGFAAFEQQTVQLSKERDLLSSQILPALRTELTSGRTPPYDFDCTLVRTDINNFSKIFNEHSVDAFVLTINDFFSDVSHIVSRYGGLVHEFIGDEVIFYFKDSDVGNSAAIALAAVRDINAAAAHYDRLTRAERGYPFTVKSSLAHGRVRFGRFVNGFSLAGSVLIETVRILSSVHEKSGNTIVFDQRHLGRTEGLAHFAHYAKTKLKGFSDEMDLWSTDHTYSLEKIIDDKGIGALPLFTYFRDDQSLGFLLIWAQVQGRQSNWEAASRVIGFLRCVNVTRSDRSPCLALMSWVEEILSGLESQTEETKGRQHLRDNPRVRLLASAFKLFENLVPLMEFDERITHLARRATRIDDRRVIANALEVLMHFKAQSSDEFVVDLMDHTDNRVAANALIHDGLRDLGRPIVNRLRKMLESDQISRIASALYAMGELSLQHRHRDPVYYNTQLRFQDLLQTLPLYVTHDNPMVRRQALMTVRKVADSDITWHVWSSLTSLGNPSYLREAEVWLGLPQLAPDPNRSSAA